MQRASHRRRLLKRKRGGYEGHEESDESAAENGETDWDLGDAADEYAGPETSFGNSERRVGVEELVQSFVTEHPPPSYTAAPGRLPCPVIIPQRRPQNNSRGFVRAYAPVLYDCQHAESRGDERDPRQHEYPRVGNCDGLRS